MPETITKPGTSVVVGANMIAVGKVVVASPAGAKATNTARLPFEVTKKFLSEKRLRRPSRLSGK